MLCDGGYSLSIYDKKPLSELHEEAKTLEAAGAELFCEHDFLTPPKGELIFRSPGIRPDHPSIRSALERGAELTSEIELFLNLTDAETFAVTGSDGKTTSTTLTHLFLSEHAKRLGRGKVLLGGNIGAPLLDRLGEVSYGDRAVMELSSFQLMRVGRSPHHAAITNLSPNHLDWHTDMQEYIDAKRRIVGENTQRFVTNADNAVTAAIAEDMIAADGIRPPLILFSSTKASYREIYPKGSAMGDAAIYLKDGLICFDNGSCAVPLLDTARIRVPGRHNIENFMTAIGLTFGLVSPTVYETVADSFTGVAHRLESVRTLDGVEFFNSSIDSSPSRTCAALSALAGRDTVAICGGYDKKIPFEPLATGLCRSVRAVVLTGATADKIEEAILSSPDYKEGHPAIHKAPAFEDAVRLAASLGKVGGCVLLSPACASFDAFKNFMERGERFRELVMSL